MKLPYTEGDFVAVGQTVGRVQRIGRNILYVPGKGAMPGPAVLVRIYENGQETDRLEGFRTYLARKYEVSPPATPITNKARRPLSERNLAINSKVGLIEEVEFCVCEATEKRLADGRTVFRAKVSQANVVNGNRRVYPGEVMHAAIASAQPRIESGALQGSVDHYSGMTGTCLKWTSLDMTDDGGIHGTFVVSEKHSRGSDLLALINDGFAIPFSTNGRGSAHRPSDGERMRFGLGDEDDDVVVIDSNYAIRKIDCVDDPSEESARMLGRAAAS